MGSTMTFLKHIPPELLVEYIIPCLQLVEVKEFMQTCVLYYKIGKSQMYKQFIYRLNHRLNQLHPALLLQQFDSFNADWYPQIQNRIVYRDLLQEVYRGFKPDPSIQSYNYVLGFFILHGELNTKVPSLVKFVQEHLPESAASIKFVLTSSAAVQRHVVEELGMFRLGRRTWEATSTWLNRKKQLIHNNIKVVVESVVSQVVYNLEEEDIHTYSGLTLTTPYLSGSTLVVPRGTIS